MSETYAVFAVCHHPEPRLLTEDGSCRLCVNKYRLGLDDCSCPIALRGAKLYGISMGKYWVRLVDDPTCPMHGAVLPEPVETAEEKPEPYKRHLTSPSERENYG